MPRFAANLSMLYNDVAFLDRFAAAARDGFTAVDTSIRTHAMTASDTTAKIVADLTTWLAGERGMACLPGREAEFRSGIAQAIDYARALACPRIHVMAGIVADSLPPHEARATYVANLREAARLAAPHDIDLLLEAINERDMPGFFLNRQHQTHALLAEIGAPNVKMQMDLYHCQISEGDLATKIRHYLPGGRVGHIQIAGVPERYEPDIGEVNYPYLFKLLDDLGYDGWIGCEYRPVRGSAVHATQDGLGWLQPWLQEGVWSK